jgi:uncharacterized protein
MHADQPLSEQEFNTLDQFLLSDRCSENAMTLDALHGYLTAIVIGPEPIPPDEWMSQVWGPSPEDVPSFQSDKEAKRIHSLIMRFMTEIAITFEAAPKEFEPLFLEHAVQGKKLLDGEAWAWGFWEGMNLRADAWEAGWESPIAPALRAIYLLGAEEVEEEEVALADDPVKRHHLALEIEAALPTIHRFWQERRKAAHAPIQRTAPKTGRNDLCHCGSGKKFKQCCGVPDRIAE